MMSCNYADYDPAYLGAAGGDWLEERPNPSLSPKAVRKRRRSRSASENVEETIL